MSTFEATGIVSAIAASAGAMAAILGAFTQWRKNKPQGDAQDNRKAVREGDNEFPTEPASQRRDYAEEQEARLKRHMEAIQSVLELEKDAKRREVLETSLRDVQDRWLHHLEIGTLFLDEADPSLLDDPKYVLALRAQLRSEAPKATAIEPATPAEAQSRRELLDRIARSAEAEPSAADLLAEANTLRSVGDHAAAIEKYTLSLGKEESFDAFFGRGYSRNELGSHEDALADYDRALRLQQDDPVTHNNRGVALRRLGRLPEALAAHDRSLQLRPDDPDTLNNRGVALLNLGRYEESLKSLSRALEIQPDLRTALSNVACAHSLESRFDEALAFLSRAIAAGIDETGRRRNAREEPAFAALRADPEYGPRFAELVGE